MPDIAILGDADSITMFKTIGASIYEASKEAEAQKALEEVLAKQYDLLFITENLKPALHKKLEEYPNLIYAYLPPVREATGAGKATLEKMIQKTIGKSGL